MLVYCAMGDKVLIVGCGRWDKTMTDTAQKESDERAMSTTDQGTNLRLVPAEERKTLRKQAQDLLSGKAKWTPGWADFQRDGRPLAGM